MKKVLTINSEEDLDLAIERLNEIWGAASDCPEADEINILVPAIEAYELAHHPMPSDRA